MVGQIDDGRFAGHRGECDRKLSATGDAVGDLSFKPAGIAFLAVRTDIGQRDKRRRVFTYVRDRPGFAIEASQAAMQRVGAVVRG